jgi:ADYC domain-containing protein/pentapeptide repeat protein
MRAILLLLAACTVEGVSDNVVEQDVDAANGVSLNGVSLNGVSLNGTSLSGATLSSVSVTGHLSNGTTVTATSSTAPPLTGTTVVGSTWTGTASNGQSVNLRIDSASQGTSPNADLWFYGVSYQNSSGWQPLCGTGVLAIPVAGVWSNSNYTYSSSTTQFTWACRAKTIGKCVELGYKTYKGYSTQLASCVRLLRADYCGTGTAYTQDGTTLNLYDNLGIQKDTETWTPEAEWLPTGARCVTARGKLRITNLGIALPACVSALPTDSQCGTSFSHGAVMIDELP